MKTKIVALVALAAMTATAAAQEARVPTGYEVKGSACYRLDYGNSVVQVNCDGTRRARATALNDHVSTGPINLNNGTGGGGSGAGADAGGASR